MTEFDVLRAAADGMDAQRASLEVAARNVAAAEANPDGSFGRLVPQFVFADPTADDGAPTFPSDVSDPFSGDPSDGVDPSDDASHVIRFAGTQQQRGVDVDAVTEMVAVLDAQRAYEANASVFDAGKQLMERTIDMGRL
ncbi:MAG TPA: flagellar basal body rod C-terminal domain-containing protein [Candidatus Acidoferrales bacterium]|nr:flagellar basal body rod C-terminal domain-containing protein [Candidatus Acidoferrales bacterium]